jgi:hypothetical protein
VLDVALLRLCRNPLTTLTLQKSAIPDEFVHQADAKAKRKTPRSCKT